MRIEGNDRPIVWLAPEVKAPPMSPSGRLDAGELLRRLQMGERLQLPASRTMPMLGPRCNELRIRDQGRELRIIYRTDTDAVIVADVFWKRTRVTPDTVRRRCLERLRRYDRDVEGRG